jgi:hypothetical protein
MWVQRWQQFRFGLLGGSGFSQSTLEGFPERLALPVQCLARVQSQLQIQYLFTAPRQP